MPSRRLFLTLTLLAVTLPACDNSQDPATQRPSDPNTLRSSEARAPDTSLAHRYVAQAETLANATQHDSALVYYEKALSIRQSTLGEQHPEVASIYDAIGMLYYGTGDYDQALASFDKVLAIYNNAQDDLQLDAARTHQHRGLVYWEKGDYDRTLALFEQALEVYQATYGEAHPEVAALCDNIGNVYRDLGDYDQAFHYLEHALAIRQSTLGHQHPDVARSHNNIGILYDLKGDYDRALENHHKALTLWRATLGEAHPDLAMSYQNLGIAYYNTSDYDQALAYLSQALASKLDALDAHHPSVGRSYLSLGVVHHERGDYDEALEHLNKALAIFRNTLGDRHLYVAATYHNIGSTLDEQGDYDEALEHYGRSLEIEGAILGGQHPSLASTHHNIGNTYFHQGAFDRALASHNRALEIFQATLGTHHPHVASSYQQVGNLHRERGDYSQALHFFQQALQANVPGFDDANPHINPPLDSAFSEEQLLETLSSKAQSLAASSSPASQPDLEAALATYRLATALIDRMRHGYQAEGSKLFLSQNVTELYNHAIQAALTLYRLTNNRTYLQDAFHFNEKSKAGTLLDALAEARARQFAGIPDLLLQQEQSLRIDLAFYERSLAEERLNGEAADSAKVARWQARLFSVQQAYETLLHQFETDYPSYYDMKYGAETVSIEAVQRHLLDARATLVSYFTGSDSLFIFTLTPDTVDVTAVARDSLLEEHVRAFRQAVVEQDYDRYAREAFRLYQTLMAPVRHRLTTRHLIIVPDGVLSYLPFEALLTRALPAEDALKDYRTLPYLIEAHTVSYAYSATLLLQTQQRERPPAERDFIAFAPVFSDGLPVDARSIASTAAVAVLDTTWAVRTGTGALPASREEVIAIRDLFRNGYGFFERYLSNRSQVYLEERAREARMKAAETARYRYVHLATHGFVNEAAPELSRLLLAPEDTAATEDGVLHLGEVYGLSLNAELVVLSACETGLGRLAKGEGVIGLTRGFLYAGAENLVVSLWQAPDAPTRDVMVDFYSRLIAETPRAEALRQAKIAMIRSNALTAAPYYWAPFVLIGQ